MFQVNKDLTILMIPSSYEGRVGDNQSLYSALRFPGNDDAKIEDKAKARFIEKGIFNSLDTRS